MTENHPRQDGQSLSMMYGTYADVLFVLFPFLVIVMQRLWDGEVQDVLLRPDLSIAAAILGGLAIGKFVLGLVTERSLGRYKERIVFFIALTLFVVMGPAIILLLSIVGGTDVPGFVAFLQPVLLIVSISLYTTAISISNMLTKDKEVPGAMPDQGNAPTPATHAVVHEPLSIPRRNNSDGV
ncbi:hypothetical protein [Marinobacter zhejiangensis]|uniref:Uncharacterized protein n=1 Tax=Marinobacter zhejiangensis TaxID=488535 RepID=A0A1I4LYD6_9GAMM|nr:hypothetical protein [Marinobacter zhejiangensis]SFL95747.1 hypothetical protein SAMN04487963_0729 [Marinobacter zhejiangensis]